MSNDEDDPPRRSPLRMMRSPLLPPTANSDVPRCGRPRAYALVGLLGILIYGASTIIGWVVESGPLPALHGLGRLLAAMIVLLLVVCIPVLTPSFIFILRLRKKVGPRASFIVWIDDAMQDALRTGFGTDLAIRTRSTYYVGFTIDGNTVTVWRSISGPQRIAAFRLLTSDVVTYGRRRDGRDLIPTVRIIRGSTTLDLALVEPRWPLILPATRRAQRRFALALRSAIPTNA